ncbi:MAG: hypothetical protein A2063_03825 [Gallionellales bacterium GWA2_60_142]|jgi:hypothetical protein|nr:MAG: hypothetical protein A2063_03825 [Gallionellales bacterium GWA2_60_142]HCI14328.1 hypothetical protein [Gallionellaceae bacterium]
MRAGAYALLLAAFGLSGCDRLTGEADRKTYDAEAIGYACRVSLKVPEDCMQENDGHSPTSILVGWKKANKDIEDNVIDPSMGKNSQEAALAMSAPAAAETAASEVPSAATKPHKVETH